MQRILVLGYYGRSNLGDEQYILSFKKLFNTDTDIVFLDCDKLVNFKDTKQTDIVVIGGGDIISCYFLDNINNFLNRSKFLKVIMISCGIPYIDILFTEKLENIDYIFLRTKTDLKLLQNTFKKECVSYIPDISILNKPFLSKRDPKKIGITLSRHVYNKNYIKEYNNFVKKMSRFVVFLIDSGYTVVFVPFCTNGFYSDDNIIHDDVIKSLNEKQTNKIINYRNCTELNGVQEIISSCSMYIPMRFHAVLFCIYNKTPFLPLYTTRKIDNLLKDISWNFSYFLKLNEIDIPVDLDFYLLKSKFESFKIFASTEYCGEKIFFILNSLNKEMDSSKEIIKKVIESPKQVKKITRIQEKIENTKDCLKRYLLDEFYNYRNISCEKKRKTIVNIISYYLTGHINSIYNYGLEEKIFNTEIEYNYQEEWSWVIKDNMKNKQDTYLESNKLGIFNISYIDQVDHSGSHRSGWQYVYDNIKRFHNIESDLLMDLYIDRTFNWNLEINKILGIIPYKQKWTGFIHHTFDTTFSDYNCDVLLNCPEFVESLKYCKGLFVLSEYLKEILIKRLNKIGIYYIKVYSIIHPTETNVEVFTFNKFLNNHDKKLLQIGGWLRNIYSFYDLELQEKIKLSVSPLKLFFEYKECFQIKKVYIKGKNSSNYHPSSDFLEKLSFCIKYKQDKINEIEKCISHPNISEDRMKNNWYRHFYEDISKKIQSVEKIDYLCNEDYDELLTCNIVYLNIVDASAINTLIECIIRNTPIIVNRHPAVVELLGNNYPMYITEVNNDYKKISNQVKEILGDSYMIYKTWSYLKKLNKKDFYIETFCKNLLKKLSKI